MHTHMLTREYTGSHTWYAHSHTCPQAHPGLWRLPRPQAAQARGAWHHPRHTLLGPQPPLSCPRVAMRPPDPDSGHWTAPIPWGLPFIVRQQTGLD